MKVTKQSVIFLLVSLLGGCSFAPRPYPKVHITTQTVATEPVAYLRLSAEDLSSISRPGYSLHRTFKSGEANCFVIRFAGSKAPVSVVRGTYQFYSEKEQPLELVYLANYAAVLVPREHLLTKPSPNSSGHPGFMKFGKYRVTVEYQSAGSNHYCRFDVSYFRNTTRELHGIWELKDIH
jgi:hypothetical protein